MKLYYILKVHMLTSLDTAGRYISNSLVQPLSIKLSHKMHIYINGYSQLHVLLILCHKIIKF
jgi:hypothetical protein